MGEDRQDGSAEREAELSKPFTTTVVGSFSRPRELVEATKKHAKGELSREELDVLLERATESTIRGEEEAGLDVITDGEQRRSSFVSFVGDKIPGFKVMHITQLNPRAMEILKENKVQLTYTRAVVAEELKDSVIARDEFEAARRYSKKPFKVTLPAPYLVMWESWHKTVSKDAYSTPEDFGHAYAKLLRKEVLRLKDAGVSFIQIDEPMLGDLTEAGDKPDRYRRVFNELYGQEYRGFKEELKLAVELLNEVTQGVGGVRVGVHMDRWPNKDSPYFDQGYERFLPELLETKTNQFVLEYTCYDEETRALTKDGLKSFEELKKGDEVLSLNPVTRRIEWKPVTRIHLYPYSGKMIRFAGRSFDLLVTPNHTMYIETPGTRGSHEFMKRFTIEKAERTASRSIFWFPNGEWHGSTPEFNLDEYYLFGLYIGDGHTEVEQSLYTQTGLTVEEFAQASRGDDGRFRTITGHGPTLKTYHWPRTILYIPPADKSTKKVENCLNRLGIKWTRQANGTIRFHPRKYEEMFVKCGTSAHHKTIPRDLLEAPPDHLRRLMQGLSDSDGMSHRQYQTVSRQLAVDIAELVVKIGLCAHLTRMLVKGSVIKGRKLRDSIAYRVSIKYKSRGATSKNSRQEDYTGIVWCPEVADNHNLLVERNGRFVFSGNSAGTGNPAKLVDEFPSGLEIGLGVISVQNYEVETPEQVVERAKRVIGHIEPERIWLNPDCGFAPGMFRPFPRDVAFAKLKSMTRAAEILRKEYA
jgi:5-methyltetrahydropteroyltriglutamate--homocysteine methyltransferase